MVRMTIQPTTSFCRTNSVPIPQAVDPQCRTVPSPTSNTSSNQQTRIQTLPEIV